MYILGISANLHDASACLIKDGQLVVGIEEERITRKKHAGRFPSHAIEHCLNAAGITISDVDHIGFFWDPLLNVGKKALYFLKNLPDFDHIPSILNEPLFQKAFQIAELANLSREQQTAYEQNLLDYWTTKAAIETAREEGREEGWKEGEEKGKREVALTLKRKGFSPEQIREITGLPMDGIGNLEAPNRET